ncbi:TPA: hypothetical protein NKV74_004514 [Vibrio parahaemolyticus]|uniref:hypothetical protein n=1 Tax=Vibrio parahaemolyticus TaxID=670 RepID=UPI001121D9AC|nr:hypothetical protein [Vibrio parahaemolyticus]TOD29741.1 hypothetical protein CGJ66_23710 [Vibrio parahaemolyticus]HCH4005090.1 hypothetical protein [Vibrio parahaemolyticus]
MDLISKTGEKLANSLVKSFTSNVIEKWTKYRAERFFEEFQNHLLKNRICGEPDSRAMHDIEDILSSSHGSEVIFDAYRRVSLSSSKSIGPRIIGLLTAEICIEERVADDFEELTFSVCETLNDSELLDVHHIINSWLEEANNTGNKKGSYIEYGYVKNVIDESVTDTSYNSNSITDLSIDNLYEDYGSGVQKLKNLGVLTTQVHQSIQHYKEDSERYIDQDGTLHITTKLAVFPLRYRRLLELIQQASLKD